MKSRRSTRQIAIAVIVAAGLSSAVMSSTATARGTEAHPVVWYSDAALQAINVMKPVASQSDWLTILTRSWGRDSIIPIGNGKTVDSCREVFSTIEEPGYRPPNLNLQVFESAAIACIAARAFARAMPAKTSYLHDFRMTPKDAADLPAALSLVISNYSVDKVKDATEHYVTLGKFLGAGATFVPEANPDGNAPMVTVNDGTGGIEDFSLLGRGDFNHDGIEDLLISVSSSVVGGTYTQSDLYLVTRLAPNAPMTVLKAYPDLGLGIPTFR